MLTTTPNAIKAALHRGRGKLSETSSGQQPFVPPAILDSFVEAFNARDIDRLTALMLDTTIAEIAAISTEYGVEKMKQRDTGSLHHTLFSPITHAVQPEFLAGDRGGTPRAEVRALDGEPLLLCWYEHDEGSVVRDVVRFETVNDRISKIRYHFFSPDVLAEVCTAFNVPWRSNGYRYWPRS
jgi:RNA polymerase sigma-70 factor (ECF subfamily)